MVRKKTKPTTPEYERKRLAAVIAEMTSGVKEATPEQDDFDLADEWIKNFAVRISLMKIAR